VHALVYYLDVRLKPLDLADATEHGECTAFEEPLQAGPPRERVAHGHYADGGEFALQADGQLKKINIPVDDSEIESWRTYIYSASVSVNERRPIWSTLMYVFSALDKAVIRTSVRHWGDA
jgi:hypothetical protein